MSITKTTKLPSWRIAFASLWADLFSSPIHLDSALSRLPKELKPILSPVMSKILLRPASVARWAKVRIPLGEPWSLREPGSPGMTKLAWVSHLAEFLVQNRESPRSKGYESFVDNFPPEMISEWEQCWGVAAVKDLARLLSQEPPLTMRASSNADLEGVRSALEAHLQLFDIKDVPFIMPRVPRGIGLSGYAPVLGSDAFKKGDFEIQDEGSQLMSAFALNPEVFSKFLQAQPGSTVSAPIDPATVVFPSALTVIDACAGAGGKSLAMADLLHGKGRVYSYDVSERKLQALRKRASRAGLRNIQTVCVIENEEHLTVKKFSARADIVLVDAPCSGWGVLRRNPDIKWRQTLAERERLPKVQLRLLEAYAPLVKRGGHLVFGVCTFRKQETLDVVEQFLKNNSDFKEGFGGFFGPGPSDGFYMKEFVRGSKTRTS
ncbi:methyltransferase domain-containing protein [Bdellovibrionota bacterium FG-2]